MKKFFKYLIVIVLVLLSIGGTCYFFFKHQTRRKDSEAYITNYLYSSAKVEFGANAKKLQTETGERFNSLMETKVNLDDILSTFSTYLITAKDYAVNENAIIDKLNDYTNKQNDVDAMIDSYMHRLSSPRFNRITGANEIYSQFAKMNTICADLLDYINNELNNMPIQKDSDLKFSVIDLYLKVTNSTLKNMETDENSGELKLKDESNLALMNRHFALENSVLITPTSSTNFESLNNQFIKYYNESDKTNFAENLALNLDNVSEYSDGLTSTKKAAYYFKAIYRI